MRESEIRRKIKDVASEMLDVLDTDVVDAHMYR